MCTVVLLIMKIKIISEFQFCSVCRVLVSGVVVRRIGLEWEGMECCSWNRHHHSHRLSFQWQLPNQVKYRRIYSHTRYTLSYVVYIECQ